MLVMQQISVTELAELTIQELCTLRDEIHDQQHHIDRQARLIAHELERRAYSGHELLIHPFVD